MDEDELALVSSLYGRGTTLCWLLTILACLVSWVCDRRRRNDDSLSADFIGILCLPSVAAGHTIHQVRCLEDAVPPDARPIRVTQLSRAMEASLTITETFMVLSVVLFLVAFPARCYRRAVLTAATGLFCLATEYFVYRQSAARPGRQLGDIRAHFTRSFVSDSAIITGVVLVLILACIAVAFCLAVYVFRSTPPRPVESNPGDSAGIIAREAMEIGRLHSPEAVLREIRRHQVDLHPREDRFMFLSLLASLVFMPASFVTSLIAMGIGPHGLSAGKPESSGWWSGLGYVARRFLAAFFPKTTAGFADLDQAVALATGVVILSLSLWSVGGKWYLEWKIDREARLRERYREVVRLTELRRRLSVLGQGAP